MKTAVLFLFDRDREIGGAVIAVPLSSIYGGGVSDRDITKIPDLYGKGGLVRVNAALKGREEGVPGRAVIEAPA